MMLCVHKSQTYSGESWFETRWFVMKRRADVCCSFCRTIKIVQLSYFFAVCTVAYERFFRVSYIENSVIITREANRLSLSHHMSF